MSLHIELTVNKPVAVFSANITHNLTGMAAAAGLYHALWHPEVLGVTEARDLIWELKAGLATLKGDPAQFEALNPPNGWGSYGSLVRFVEDYIAAIEANPGAKVKAET